MADGNDGFVFTDRCPARTVLAALAEKWSILILHALSNGPMRTGELRRHIQGISEKMLIQSLRKLETLNLVERTTYGEVPPRVDYRLTEAGCAVSTRVMALNQWIEDNADRLTAFEPQQVA